MTPNNAISGLIPQAQRFKANAEAIMNSPKRQQNFVGDLLVKALVPHGAKGIVRNLGKGIVDNGRTKRIGDLQNLATEFIVSCQERVRLISVNRKDLPPKGNSAVLVRKFNSALRMKNPIKAMERTIIVLEEISSLNLLWNVEIPQELEKRKELKVKALEEKWKLKDSERMLARSRVAVEALNRNEISARLEKYPTVRTSILGAIDALENGGPDAERHCVISCRTSLENLCVTIGGDNDWKTSLKKIFPSATDQRAILGIWNYLSGKGAHGGHAPSKSEAEYGLKQTIASIQIILERLELQ